LCLLAATALPNAAQAQPFPLAPPPDAYIAVVSNSVPPAFCQELIPGVPSPTIGCINLKYGIPISTFGLASEVNRALEVGAIAASMRDAIPNSGDRFALRLNVAGFGEGGVGGSVGASMNVTDRMRFSVNYGRGATQNVVSGGMNLSFR
jgi:hypothetical protein